MLFGLLIEPTPSCTKYLFGMYNMYNNNDINNNNNDNNNENNDNNNNNNAMQSESAWSSTPVSLYVLHILYTLHLCILFTRLPSCTKHWLKVFLSSAICLTKSKSHLVIPS